MALFDSIRAASLVSRAHRLLRDDVPPDEIGLAIRLALEAAEILRANHGAAHEPAALRLAARGLQMVGEFVESLKPAERAVNVAREANEPEMLMFSLGTLAFSKFALGDSAGALALQQEALEIGYTLGTAAAAARAIELGQFYAKLGRYLKAKQLLSTSLPALPQTNDRDAALLAAGFQAYGVVLACLDEAAEALTAFQQAAEIASRHGRARIYAMALLGTGCVLFRMGDHNQAPQALRAALEALKKSGRTISGISAAMFWLGMSEWIRARFGPAQALFEDALTMAHDAGESWAEAEAATALGGLYCCAGLDDSAEDYLWRAVRLREKLRAASPAEDFFRIAVADTYGSEYGYLQILMQSRGDAYGALEISEAARARAFADLLSSLQAGEAPAAFGRDEIRRFACANRTTFAEFSLVTIVDNEAMLDAQDSRPHPFRRELLIYVVRPDGSATAVRRSLWKMGSLPNDSAAAWAPPENQKAWLEWLRSLHRLLIEPIAGLLPDKPEESVVLVPAEDLLLVPFAALTDETGTPLVCRHTLLLAPSIRTQILLHNRARKRTPDTGRSVLIVANPTMPTIHLSEQPLRFSEEIAKSVAGKIYGVNPVLGPEATKARVMSLMVKCRLVHIATHGLRNYSADEEAPGAIALAPAEGDDGFLTCDELAALRLDNCDLILLTTCDSGHGRITSDGVVGLGRALLAAGAAAVVLTLAPVDDLSASHLTKIFHSAYRKSANGDVAAALREAVTRTMTAPGLEHPYHWGTFTVMGARCSQGMQPAPEGQSRHGPPFHK